MGAGVSWAQALLQADIISGWCRFLTLEMKRILVSSETCGFSAGKYPGWVGIALSLPSLSSSHQV